MSELMEKCLADKAAERKRLVSLSFEEKLTLLEKMRDRSLLIKNSAHHSAGSHGEQSHRRSDAGGKVGGPFSD